MRCVCGEKLEPIDDVLEPCQDCIKESREDGIEDGFEDGREAGYESFCEERELEERELEEEKEVAQLNKFFWNFVERGIS